MTLDLSQLPFAASVPPRVRRVFAEARLLYDNVEVERAVDRLAVRMTVDLQDQNPLLVSVMPSGLVFAGMLMRRLVFPLQHSFASLGVDADVIPAEDLRGMLCQRPVVVLDSCVDEERSEPVLGWLTAEGAGSVCRAVLLDAGMSSADRVRYTAIDAQAQALFGCGMDYFGYGANLPGIYAVAN